MGKRLIAPEIEEGPWACREFGSGVMIVTLHHGSRVVLSASPRGVLMTRDKNGTLRPLEIDHPIARFLAGSKKVAEAAARVHDESWQPGNNGSPSYAALADLRTALLSAGYEEESDD